MSSAPPAQVDPARSKVKRASRAGTGQGVLKGRGLSLVRSGAGEEDSPASTPAPAPAAPAIHTAARAALTDVSHQLEARRSKGAMIANIKAAGKLSKPGGQQQGRTVADSVREIISKPAIPAPSPASTKPVSVAAGTMKAFTAGKVQAGQTRQSRSEKLSALLRSGKIKSRESDPAPKSSSIPSAASTPSVSSTTSVTSTPSPIPTPHAPVPPAAEAPKLAAPAPLVKVNSAEEIKSPAPAPGAVQESPAERRRALLARIAAEKEEERRGERRREKPAVKTAAKPAVRTTSVPAAKPGAARPSSRPAAVKQEQHLLTEEVPYNGTVKNVVSRVQKPAEKPVGSGARVRVKQEPQYPQPQDQPASSLGLAPAPGSLSPHQLEQLSQEFDIKPQRNPMEIKALATKTGLSSSQVVNVLNIKR